MKQVKRILLFLLIIVITLLMSVFVALAVSAALVFTLAQFLGEYYDKENK